MSTHKMQFHKSKFIVPTYQAGTIVGSLYGNAKDENAMDGKDGWNEATFTTVEKYLSELNQNEKENETNQKENETNQKENETNQKEKENETNQKENENEKEKPNNLRFLTTRQKDELREIECHLNPISSVDGSCFIRCRGIGETSSVICAVSGPKPIRGKGDIDTEEGTITVRFDSEAGVDEEMAQYIKEAISPVIRRDSFPFSEIEIKILALEDHGSIFSAAVMTASVALICAGIPMDDLVTACEVVSLDGIGLVADPNDRQERFARGTIRCAYLPDSNQVTQLTQVGNMSVEEVNEGLSISIDACMKLREILKSVIDRKMKKTSSSV